MVPPILPSHTPSAQQPVASASNSNAARNTGRGQAVRAAHLNQTGLPGAQSAAGRAAHDREYLSFLERWVQESPGLQRQWIAGVIRGWMTAGDRSAPLVIDFRLCPDRDGSRDTLPARLPSDITQLKIIYFAGTALGLTEFPPFLTTLIIDSNRPVSLPQLGDGLEVLHLQCDQPNSQGAFFQLPEQWGAAMRNLTLICGESLRQAVSIAELPDHLETFRANGLGLTEVPNLGPRIESLNLTNNRITRVRPWLPDSTVSVTLNRNLFVDVPVSLLAHPRRTIIVDPPSMTPETLERLRPWEELRSVHGSVYRGSAAEAAEPPFNWSRFTPENGAAEFGEFLRRLPQTSEYKEAATREDFKQRVGHLLDYLEGNQEARQECFSLAYEATASCSDRVALSLLDMEKLCRNLKMRDAIRAGRYDDRKQEVINFCMDGLRSEVVDRAAQRAALNARDPVETHLGFIVAMSKEFTLAAEMKTMLYPTCSDITPREILLLREQLTTSPFTASAKRLYESFFTGSARDALCALPEYSDPSFSVKAEERSRVINEGVMKFLSTSEAMRELMRRSKPKSMARLEQRIADRVQKKENSLHAKLEKMQAQVKRGALSEDTHYQKARDIAVRYAALKDETRARKSLSQVQRFIERNHLDARLSNDTSEAREWMKEAMSDAIWST